MPDEQSASARRNPTVEQKTGFVLLLIFGVLGVSLGTLQIRNTLLRPFSLNNSIPSDIKDQVANVDAFRFRDTDGDGLSDYDELYVYHTSPYLYDTFGYGMSDKEVVEKGLPLCAHAGKDCSDASTVLGPSSTIPQFVTSTQDVPDFNKVISDPVQIRKLLLDSGIKQEVLDKLSDSELMALVAQTMASTTIFKATTTH